MSPRPAPAGPSCQGRLAHTAPAAALWATLAAFAATSLQGCAVKFLNSKQEDSKSPLEVCPAFRFKGNGFVAEARAGEPVNISCPTDFTYHGPPIECSWVDKFCVAYDQNEINPEFCYNQYNLTLAGQGLTAWPQDVKPKIMPPPTAGSSAGLPGVPGGTPFAVPGANATRPARRLASTTLPQIVTPDQLSCKDEGWADLNFVRAAVDNSHPLDDKYAWSLRYREITKVQGQKVDLLVTTVKVNISGKPERTGKGSAMGRININCSNTVPFKFKFVKSLTGEPVMMKKVFFTLFDIVDPADPKNDKQVTAGGMSEYFVSKKTLIAIEKLDNGEYTFGRGPLSQNMPGKPVNIEKASVKQLWLDSLNRTVILMFRNTSEFMIYVKVTPGPAGRDFEFTGWSEVARFGRKVITERVGLQAKFWAPPGEAAVGPARSLGPAPADALLAAALGALALGGAALALRRRLRPSPWEPAAQYTAYPCRGPAAE